ncbi:hypothetical protein FNF29_05402 [Cafeteria roenbergensis]|uniref:CSN8/PSMD8/EIF3K domain-containing protein n=1 Tax=Cafeteria roenbergensis TaxID=33653 RepID=A0A5A8CEC1_CAFRO|nr:hypothetical protein FNF29_05402 [Cafeteria roenbergensis]|eukprot:KAA0150161.1 hypothetical protein FNF29_05402 [Cafeteria roenbergensis]
MAAVPTDKANALLASLRAVTSRFDSSAVVGDEELAAAAATMRDLRMVLTEFPSLPPTSVPHASAVEQQTIARSAFEQACLLAVRAGDGAALERAWSQLVPFYGDLARALGPSADKPRVAGLYLLHLLVSDKLAEFHCEMELLSEAERAAASVAFPALLEARMTEGAYNRVLEAASSPPSSLFAPMVAAISAAVRDDAARCAQASYRSLPVDAAAAMLHLPSATALREYAAASHPDWKFESAPAAAGAASSTTAAAAGPAPRKAGPRVVFPASSASLDAIPAVPVIERTLQYANDMERIV